jgi:hypothetical protein
MRVITWQRQWGPDDPVVWVNVAKLDAAWQLDNLYVGAPGSDTEILIGKYERVGSAYHDRA